MAVTDWASRTTTYSYDDNGRLVQTVYPNNTRESRSYDLSGKLTRIQDLDPSGNVIYRCANQLDVTGRTVGERVTPAPTSFSIPDATMTFDADNRLNNFNGQPMSFDADGNMTSGPSAITLNAIAYSYDARNRLTSAGNVSYNYNPDGRRTSLSDATVNPNGVSSTFVIDLNARLDRTLVRNKGGNATYYVLGFSMLFLKIVPATSQNWLPGRYASQLSFRWLPLSSEASSQWSVIRILLRSTSHSLFSETVSLTRRPTKSKCGGFGMEKRNGRLAR